jgi:hypothetical protein
MPEPTYYITTTDDETMVYHCCYCERAGQEHHATDEALFLKHMEQRHDGRMIEGPAPEEPALQQVPDALPQDATVHQAGEPLQEPLSVPTGETVPIPEPTPTVALPAEEQKPEEGA